MKCSVFCGLSLDGFIARTDGRVDFLEGHGDAGGDMGFGAFLASVDCLVMGRNTFDTVMAMDVEWPYGDLPVFVATHRALPDGIPSTAGPIDGSPAEIASALNEQGFDHAYVDGGETVQAFLAEGLIDELVLTYVPVLIGDGISLFGALPADVAVDLRETTEFPNGCLQVHYSVTAR